MKNNLHRVIFCLTFALLNGCALAKSTANNSPQNPIAIDAKQKTPKLLGWGGGGAFTGVTELNGTKYLSSDVAGVWVRDNVSSWTPFVTGLSNYNVTGIIAFRDTIYAATSTEVLSSNGRSNWAPTNVKAKTYRGTNTTVFAKDLQESVLCIASLESKITCFDDKHESRVYKVNSPKIRGLAFTKDNADTLYYYAGDSLFELNLNNKEIRQIYKFGEKIVNIVKLNNSTFIATQKNIFNVTDPNTSLYSVTSGQLINVFSYNDPNQESRLMANIGSKWNAKLYEMDATGNSIKRLKRVELALQKSLPHRSIQKSLTKYLSINSLNDKLWVTDYWGAYELTKKDSFVLTEITDNAINTVATDFLIDDNQVYISSMDNGLIKLTYANNSLSELRDILPLSQSLKRGHSWSISKVGDAVYSNISSWNDPNDYLFEYTKNGSSLYPFTNYNDRAAKKTFWGKAYSRKLAYLNGFYSFRDGDKGGLIKIEKSKSVAVAKGKGEITAGDYNRVFRGLTTWKQNLYFADCSSNSTLYKYEVGREKSIAANLPNSFCTFDIFTTDNALFLLGSDNKGPVIYEISNNIRKKYLSSKKGSAFFAMAINPNDNSQIVSATTSWSTKPTSTIYTSSNNGITFEDKGCLLTHRNGVVSIKFSEDGQSVFILQKVGGLMVMPSTELFERECV